MDTVKEMAAKLFVERCTVLDRSQVLKLLKLDEDIEQPTHWSPGASVPSVVMWITTLSPRFPEYVKWLFEINEMPFTQKIALYYGYRAEEQGKFALARVWYWIVREMFSEPFYYRCACVRHGALEEVEKRIPDLFEKELTAIGYACLRRGDPETALKAFLKCEPADQAGIRAVRRRAVTDGNPELAERTAWLLGAKLTQGEIVRLANKLVQYHESHEETFRFLRRHRLTVLSRQVLKQLVVDEGAWLAKLRKAARLLGLELTTQHLELRFCRLEQDGLRYDSLVKCAIELAKRSPKWRKRLPAVYLQARNSAVLSDCLLSAARYGRKCNKPLTLEELRAFVTQRSSDRRYDEQLEFAKKLIAKRLGRKPKKSSTKAIPDELSLPLPPPPAVG